jgi:signal recognition particle subunit SRP54
MFDRLSEGFSNVFKKLSGKGSISEANVREAIQEVRSALLEADVALPVVESFCEGVVKDSLGHQVTRSLEPGQEMIGIVYRRLIELLGGQPRGEESIYTAPVFEDRQSIMPVTPGPTIVMMCGLQGSGKTTTCGKLAAYLKKRGRSVMVAAADLQRPAAVEQLRTVVEAVQTEMPGGASVSFYAEPDKCAEYGRAVGVAVGVCQRALAAAQRAGVDTLILDTAGRLHVNDELMGELIGVSRTLHPHHTFLVVDAMTGQDAVQSAKAFHDKLGVDSVILTKFDSDTRGGAALSVRSVTGATIKFIGVGEKLDALEEFHPERAAGRILGMGDVVSLVEKAQQEVSEEEAQRLQAKLAKGEMSMEDFLSQLKTLRRMGPLKSLMGLLPGVGPMLKNVNIEDKQLDRVEAMINSMTTHERRSPDAIDNSRRRRIAAGSGTQPNDVGTLVKQFSAVSKLTKQMAGMSVGNKVRAMKEMGGAPGPLASGLSPKGSSHTPSIKIRFKKRK